LQEKRKEDGLAPLQLQPDHFYATSLIAKSPQVTRWRKVYAKASPRVQEQMEKGLKDVGDLLGNLFSMHADANMHWKNGRKWSELNPADGAEHGYSVDDVVTMQKNEARVEKIVNDEIEKVINDAIKEEPARHRP